MDNNDAALLAKIESLKKSRNAVILAHNYQLGEIQDIADFVGDSLELAQEAARTTADVIVCCGVQYMAETALILNPEKTVLIPDTNANCPLANMITVIRLREMKKEYPEAIVVAYVKTPAAIKAEADICCATENAVSIVQHLPSDRPVIFVPDQYLGNYVSAQTGREILLWPGYCSTHLRVQPRDIQRLKSQFPQAKVIAHPQSRPEVTANADAVLSSAGMLRFAKETDAREIIVATEVGMLHRLRKENPNKVFLAASDEAVCHRMKLIRLETVLWSLENMTHKVTLPERIIRKAKPAVQKMLDG